MNIKNTKKDDDLLEEMKKMGPSAIDAELRSLSEEMGGSVELMERFLKFILHHLTVRKNFELVSSYLALFLKLHGKAVADEDDLCRVLEQIKEVQSTAWASLKSYFNKNLCLVSYFKSVT
jgi:U3 small nucleolar RNA-associated protein 21